MNGNNQRSVRVFDSLHSKLFDWVSWSKTITQMNNHNEGFLHLFCSLRGKIIDLVSWSKITWPVNNHDEGSVHLFYWLSTRGCELVNWSASTWQMIVHLPTLVLFIYFTHFARKIVSWPIDRSSHSKWKIIFKWFCSPTLSISKQRFRLDDMNTLICQTNNSHHSGVHLLCSL